MGSVAFFWQHPQMPGHALQLVQMEGLRKVELKWLDEDEKTKDIYAARDVSTERTLLGVSKLGRFACLTSPICCNKIYSDKVFGNGPSSGESLPIMFLKDTMSPREFAEGLQSNKDLSSGLAFNMVVADIPLKSMFFISKKSPNAQVVETKLVDPGYHQVFENGLDDSSNEDEVDMYKHLLEINRSTYTKYVERKYDSRISGHTVVRIETTGKIKFLKYYVDDEFDPETEYVTENGLGDYPKLICLPERYEVFSINTGKVTEDLSMDDTDEELEFFRFNGIDSDSE